MSDTDESAVLVNVLSNDEAPELITEKDLPKKQQQDRPQALQIVGVGSADDAYAFKFDKAKLTSILKRIPADCKVAVVSVVGAFRTGKSFLLSWFLQYLTHLEESQDMGREVGEASEEPWYKTVRSLGNEGFHWKGGSERDTTGIWMWNHPFFVETSDHKKLAVLLVDTQGMFDHETTMSLTASIFGLSTLLSSYQIYNVDKRVQEDNFQQLALFSEYARTAMAAEDDDASDDDKDNKEEARKPFQQVEFLVRDWQHFDEVEAEGDDDDDTVENYEAMEKSMEEYLEKAIADRDAKDLSETREQIVSCFEKITCYGLSHPGFSVTKKKFTGDVSSIEEQFMHLLDRYCRRVFDPKTLQAKSIHGRELTATELGTYTETYAELFASGAKFPTAATLLEATVTANNTNAVHMALAAYKETLDPIAGPASSNYVKPEELQEENTKAFQKSLKTFESIATFGNKAHIADARAEVLLRLDSQWEVYESLNNGRNPLAGFETYLLPMAVAFGSFVLQWIVDLTCSPYSQVCQMGSAFFAQVYAVVFCFLGIVAITKAQQVRELIHRLLASYQALSSAQSTSSSKSLNKKKKNV